MSVILAAGLGMGALSLVSGIMGAKAAAKEADRKREAEMSSAVSKFSTVESNTNLQKSVLREQTKNAQVEVLRAGAEQNKEIDKELTKITSSTIASKEGLTSGRSAGRQMMVLQQKGSQAINDSNTQASNQIAQMVESKDKMTNDLNANLISAHSEMAGVLSTPGQIFEQNVAQLVTGTVTSGLQGALMGKQLDSK